MFLVIILGATDRRAPQGFAPIAIGLGLNPARSTGPALFVGGWALQQLWLFWVAPILGAAIAGLAYTALVSEPAAPQLKAAVIAKTA